MQFPLVILGVGSIVTGILFWNELPKAFHLPGWFERFTSTTFEHWLAPALERAQAAHAAVAGHGLISHETLLWLVPVLGTAAAVFGLLVARALYGKGPTGKTVAEFPSSAPYGFGARWTWAFDSLYAWTVVKPVKLVAFGLYWVVELALVTGFTHLFSLAVSAFGGGLVGMQRSRLRSAMVMSFVGVAVILALLLWKV